MRKIEPVNSLMGSVREDGVPTGLMVLHPVLELESGKTVAIGVAGARRAKRYGVVINGRMLGKHRSKQPLSPSQLEVDKEGEFALLCGKQVARLRPVR